MPACPGLEAPVRAMEIAIGRASDRQGRFREIQQPCESVPGHPDKCQFIDLGPGQYTVWQGPFSEYIPLATPGQTRVSRDGEVALDCNADCSRKIVVETKDGCAETGGVTLWNSVPLPFATAIATGQWRAGEPLEFPGLPCNNVIAEIELGRCTNMAAHFRESEWRYTLRKESLHRLTVLNDVTDEPIPDAMVLGVWRGIHPLRTDRSGQVEFNHLDSNALQIQAIGFSALSLPTYNLPEPTVPLQVRLTPARPYDVRCRQGDAPCRADTSVSVTSASDGYLPCSWRDVGTWECWGAFDETVAANLDWHMSPPAVLVENGFTDVFLSAGE